MEQTRFILRKRKRKYFEDSTWINTDRMPYYSSNVISLYACGSSLYLPGYRQKTGHPQAYWSVEYICEGEYTVLTEDRKLQLTAGSILIHYPGKYYVLQNSGSEPVRKKEIMLNNSPLISILCNRTVLNSREAIRCVDPAAAEAYFDRVLELISRPDPSAGQGRLLSETVFSLFMELLEQCGENNIYNSFDAQLDHLDVLSPDLTLDRIASHFKTGKSTLNRMFLKQLNLTPFQYVIAMRMRYAVQLLNSNSLSIREVAEECGYRSTSFFIAEFKKYFQKTPLEYRSSLEIFNNRRVHLLDGWNIKQKKPRKETGNPKA